MEKENKKPRKTDHRTLYTKKLIQDSLLAVLYHKNFEQITVTEVCKRANITRATFYLHYKTLTDVLDELLTEALETAEKNVHNPDKDVDQILNLLHYNKESSVIGHESMLPVTQKVGQLSKYRPIFKDETLSSYVVNKIYQSQRRKLVPVFMDHFNLSQKEAEMLVLFIINGTFSVNKAMNWTKDETWYEIHAMLMKFAAGGYDNLKK